MKKIIIKGLSGSTNASNIYSLDGVNCQDDFTEYMDEPLVNKFEEGAYMEFKVIDNKLYTLTTYNLKDGVELSESEIEELIDYTQGQWSDGIGEGFEQYPVFVEEDEEIYISPWFYGQEAEYQIINNELEPV